MLVGCIISYILLLDHLITPMSKSYRGDPWGFIPYMSHVIREKYLKWPKK